MTDTEINEAVAKKLGWLQIADQSVDPGGTMFKTFKRGDHVACVGSRYPLPNYCHKIEAAWEIVEHLAQLGKMVSVGFNPHTKKWMMKLWHLDDAMVGPGPEADTASRAICLAFLKLSAIEA